MTLSILLAGALLAAAPQSPSGIFGNVPLFLMTQNQEEIHVVGGAAQDAVPASSMDPIYSAASMFGASNLKIASFSTGRAFVTLHIKDIAGERRGTADLAELQGSWSFLLYSLANENPGQPGSPYESAGNPVRGDVFARVLEGSENYIPVEQVGDIRWARLGTDMNVGDVKGLDSYGYAQLLDPQVDVPVAIYFTVDTDQSPARPGTSRWAGVPSGDYLASTIFRVDWNGGGWSDVQVHKLAGDLGIAPTDAIDALTVDVVQNVILLSLKGASLDRQLWVWSDRTNELPHSGPYYDADGDRFYVDKYLLLKEGDDIDGACVDDPLAPEHSFDTGYRHQWRQIVMQLPLITFPNPTPSADTIDCSGFRLVRPNGLDKYHLYLRNTFGENIVAVLRRVDAAQGDPIVGNRYFIPAGGKIKKKMFYVPPMAGSSNGPEIFYWEIVGATAGRVTSWPFEFLK